MPSSFNRAMGKLIRDLRKAQGLSQKDVGTALGVSYQQVSKLESGANSVPSCRLPKLAQVLGLSIAEIYHRLGARNAYRAEGI